MVRQGQALKAFVLGSDCSVEFGVRVIWCCEELGLRGLCFAFK